MIVLETAAGPAVRVAEGEIAGRRIAGRLLPYGADAGSRSVRFDPVERRFALARRESVVAVGPAGPEPWGQATLKIPVGPVLVGPCANAEDVRGAFLAAAEGAIASGRGVYLLDPEPAGLPGGAGRSAVVLCSWRPGRPEAAFPGLDAARAAGLRSAALFPLLPGWTGEAEALEALARAAVAGGATSLTAVVPSADGEGRRAIVEARAQVDPEAAERFFEFIHHADWATRLADRLAEVRAVAAKHGLACLPPRPVGLREPAGNAAAAARLEEAAELSALDEHRAARLLAAVRWIDECGRDLAAVAREGNFRKVFPFEGEIVEAAEAALRGVA